LSNEPKLETRGWMKEQLFEEKQLLAAEGVRISPVTAIFVFHSLPQPKAPESVTNNLDRGYRKRKLGTCMTAPKMELVPGRPSLQVQSPKV